MSDRQDVLTCEFRDGRLIVPTAHEAYGMPPLEDALERYAAIRIPGVLSPDECITCSERLYQMRLRWRDDYGGEQFSLPDNYYARVSGGTVEEYFSSVVASRKLMAESFPHEQKRFLQLMQTLIKAETVPLKKGWCGPGFVIFPEGEYVAVNNGPIHVDAEGLVDGELVDSDARACALVLMVQKPQWQGGVRVWNFPWDPLLGETHSLRRAENSYSNGYTIEYELGDLVVLNSLKPHQILSFGGGIDRITMNAFGSFVGGRWQFWF